MKASDYRIGNCINRKYSDNTIETERISVYDLLNYEKKEYSSNNLVEWLAISPIRINEDWLITNGFELMIYNGLIKSYSIECTPPNYKTKMHLVIRFNEIKGTEFSVYWYHLTKSGDMHGFEHIEHIHNIQNLYLSLSGKELEIK